MGPRPSGRHSLDRIDVNGNYEPGNCRWATQREQMQNTRANAFLTHNGETLCISEWARRVGMSRDTIAARIRLGWAIEAALTVPPKMYRRQKTTA